MNTMAFPRNDAVMIDLEAEDQTYDYGFLSMIYSDKDRNKDRDRGKGTDGDRDRDLPDLIHDLYFSLFDNLRIGGVNLIRKSLILIGE